MEAFIHDLPMWFRLAVVGALGAALMATIFKIHRDNSDQD